LPLKGGVCVFSVGLEEREPPGLSFLVNKAETSTNSTVMEELVCLSVKWNILKASNPAV